MRTLTLLAVTLLAAAPAVADSPKLGFKESEKPGLYDFDTGLLRGTLKLDGRFQGLYPVVDVATGREITRRAGHLQLLPGVHDEQALRQRGPRLAHPSQGAGGRRDGGPLHGPQRLSA